MKSFVVLAAALLVAGLAASAMAQHCQRGGGTPTSPNVISTAVPLIPMTTATPNSTSLATSSQQAYLRQFAYQQQLQQAYFQQAYLQQQQIQMQFAQERMAQAQREQQRRDQKLEARRERRAAELAKREETRQKNATRRDAGTRIAARD